MKEWNDKNSGGLPQGMPPEFQTTEEKKGLTRALKLLLVKDRTQWELTDQLLSEGYAQSDVQKILEYVKSFGYINDRRYVDLYLISHGDRYSIREMQQKLRSRGISKDFFYEVLESSDYEGEEPALKKILAKRLKGRSVEELTYEEKQKHMAYFARKGYSFEKIREIFSFS